MWDKPIEKWSRKELDAELELYREGEVEGVTVASDEALTNRELAAAEITRLRELVGYPHRLTQEDLDANKELVDEGAEVGEIVYFSQAEVDEKRAAAEKAAQEAEKGPEGDDGTGTPPPTEPGASTAPQAQVPVPVNTEGDLVYQGRTVHSHQNKIINGKRYIEVNVGSAIHTLTLEEFERDVKRRA